MYFYRENIFSHFIFSPAAIGNQINCPIIQKIIYDPGLSQQGQATNC